MQPWAFLVFTYIRFRRYVGAVNDVKKANATLEQRLQAREAALTLSHQRLSDHPTGHAPSSESSQSAASSYD